MSKTPKGRGRGESATSPRRLKAKDKQLQALTLRKAGATYEQIAEAVGYRDKSGARKAVEAALRETLREPAEEVRELERMRLDDMQKAIWQRVLKGDDRAIASVLAIMGFRAKLDGLFAPTKIAPTTPAGDESYDPGNDQDIEGIQAKFMARFERLFGGDDTGPAPDVSA